MQIQKTHKQNNIKINEKIHTYTIQPWRYVGHLVPGMGHALECGWCLVISFGENCFSFSSRGQVQVTSCLGVGLHAHFSLWVLISFLNWTHAGTVFAATVSVTHTYISSVVLKDTVSLEPISFFLVHLCVHTSVSVIYMHI